MAKMLSSEEKKILLGIAREAIVTSVETGTIPRREEQRKVLLEQRGCFVCIKIDGKLRGCIGNFTADKPLYHLVQEMAISAATRDPRFYPMQKGDLGNFSLEVSVLTPLKKISSIDEIEVGIHGIYIEKNFSRGVLLPQVAVEYGWDREAFLNQTSMKAGMPADAWQEGADLYIFSADVFSEK
ncbi:MAG TPA: AmmeMemoRadiSam system protein A [Geobacteraceae bacterium]|jgi:AmmeMemoRadiSam system protein A|nr:AmmeMemoRadiSam system protein A [Geobacteraceae bacterium]